jgi:hypothetical protein
MDNIRPEPARRMLPTTADTAAIPPQSNDMSDRAITRSTQNYEKEREFLKKLVDRKIWYYRFAAQAWSILHHGSIFSAAILSALSALLQYRKAPGYEDMAAAFAAIASLLGVLSVTGNFPAKWRANRITKAAMEVMQIRLSSTTCNLDKASKDIEDIITTHVNAIVSEPASGNHS